MGNKDEIINILKENGINISETPSRLPNDTGWKLKTHDGAIVNVFDKGSYNVQGKNRDQVKTILDTSFSSQDGLKKPQITRKVFVVYGHDLDARDGLETLLRRWDIEPLILENLPTEGMTLIEKLEHYRDEVNFAVVLATPDDEGHKAGQTDAKAFRARQNVVLELGMMLACLGRKKVAILLKDEEKMERPSDIEGLIYISFKDDVKDAPLKLKLAKEMNAQGLSIDLQRL